MNWSDGSWGIFLFGQLSEVLQLPLLDMPTEASQILWMDGKEWKFYSHQLCEMLFKKITFNFWEINHRKKSLEKRAKVTADARNRSLCYGWLSCFSVFWTEQEGLLFNSFELFQIMYILGDREKENLGTKMQFQLILAAHNDLLLSPHLPNLWVLELRGRHWLDELGGIVMN